MTTEGQATTRQRKSRLGETQHAVAESAKKQVWTVGATAQQAVTSGAWAYPILGILYLLSHPSLVGPLLPTLLRGVVASIVITVLLFVFTYFPQMGVLLFVTGPLAPIAAIPLILAEAYLLINFFLKSFIYGQAGIDVFDAVLVQKGDAALVERGRQVTQTGGGKSAQLGRLLTKPLQRFSTDNIVRYLLSLPLNLIPVVGTVFFLGYNGFKAGPGYHARYFQLKGYDKDRRHAAIEKRRGAYTAFGTVAMVLNLVPILSILFQITSSIGAALWAHDIEGKTGLNPSQALKSGSAAKKEAGEVEVTTAPATTPAGKKEL